MIDAKILVPLDVSTMSRKILSHVCKFFDPERTHIILLQVIHPGLEEIKLPPAHAALEWTPAMYRYFEERQNVAHKTHLEREKHFREAVLKALEIDAQSLRQAGYTVSIQVELGRSVEKIEAVITQEQVDLVAMTTHAREGVGRLLFGSISGKIIHDITTIPVMLLHPSS